MRLSSSQKPAIRCYPYARNPSYSAIFVKSQWFYTQVSLPVKFDFFFRVLLLTGGFGVRGSFPFWNSTRRGFFFPFVAQRSQVRRPVYLLLFPAFINYLTTPLENRFGNACRLLLYCHFDFADISPYLTRFQKLWPYLTHLLTLTTGTSFFRMLWFGKHSFVAIPFSFPVVSTFLSNHFSFWIERNWWGFSICTCVLIFSSL